MNFLKYIFNSQFVFRIDFNIFNRQNYVFPKFVYKGPTEPYDTKHYTVGLIIPFLQILFDFDCQSEKDKLKIFKSKIDNQRVSDSLPYDFFADEEYYV